MFCVNHSNVFVQIITYIILNQNLFYLITKSVPISNKYKPQQNLFMYLNVVYIV